MNVQRTMAAALVLAGIVSLGSDSFAKRTPAPANGAPYPSTIYDHFSYGNATGILVHEYTGGTDNWDLTCSVDGSGAETARVYAKGNQSLGVSCWGVVLGPDGSASLGNTAGVAAGCSGNAAPLDTPSVTIPTNGAFLVTCQLPPATSSCKPKITFYQYAR
jgi:hypothetical protein